MTPMKALVALAALSLVLVACGSGGTKTVTETRTVEVDPTGETSTSASASATGSEDCDELGINNKVMNTGTCKDPDGTELTVVNRDDKLAFPREYEATLEGVETAEEIAGEYGDGYTASGTLVIATVTITNKSRRPRSFEGDDSYAALSIDGRLLTPSFDAMNGPAERSCLWLEPAEIQPESSKTCQIVFDVADKFVPLLDDRGAAPNLLLIPFSEAETYEQSDRVGVIRLYEAPPPTGSSKKPKGDESANSPSDIAESTTTAGAATLD